MATTGALLAFGWRDGDLARPFRQAGRVLLSRVSMPGATLPLTATLIGALHHLLLALLWGALLGIAVRSFRGAGFVLASLAFAVTFSLLNLWLVPPMFGVGVTTVTSLARAVPFALAVTVALLVTPWASGVGDGPSVA